MKYVIRRAVKHPELEGKWEGRAWKDVDTIEIAGFRPEGSDHRPETHVKLLYDDEGIYGIFQVKDCYVRCVHTEFQGPVCRDSCVEFFVQPAGGEEYFNFEFNCGGALLARCVQDPFRESLEADLRAYKILSPEDGAQVGIYHSMPRVVEPEITEETEWIIEFFIPFSLLAKYVGELGEIAGREWRANLFKCGDKTSHPHWVSWAPLDECNFHLPRCFGVIQFEP